MTPPKVYCEHGALRTELYELQKIGQINLVLFPYEEKVKRIKEPGVPSEAAWSEMNFSWENSPGSWEDYKGSTKYVQIQEIIGRENKRDVKHLDSAFKSNCQAFLTRDKGDILSKKNELEEILKMKFFHPDDDWVEFCKFIE